MEIEIIQKMRNWGLFQGFTDDDIQQVLDKSIKRTLKSGVKLCTQGDEGNSMFIIYSGRVSMDITLNNGKEKNLNILQQGDHFGELLLLSGGTRTATAVALTDVVVLEIEKKNFSVLIKNISLFSINLSKTISRWLQGELKGCSKRKELQIVAIVRTSEITAHFPLHIIQWFINKGEKVAIFSDRPKYWKQSNIEEIHTALNDITKIDNKNIQNKIIKALERYEHVIVDIDQQNITYDILSQCERVWWLLEQKEKQGKKDGNQAQQCVETFLHEHPSIKNQIQYVLAQPHSYPLSDINVNFKTKPNDIRCQFDPTTHQLRPRDLSRFYHLLKGVHIGIALGGGGARCLAHIGVLAALEENDLYFDRISGTSGGAIISTFYAAGFSKEYILKLFEANMTPPKLIRLFPHGHKWYLMTLFRFGLIEKRFHQIFGGMLFEQLLLPTHVVCSDLISGKEIVRSHGNIANSVLESINHPLLSKPIFRDGEALVDGGILNNVPSSVLRANNVDYVVSVNIGAKITPTFGKNGSGTATSDMKKVGFLGTLSRVLEVGQDGLEKTYEDESDFLILPDTSDYLFEDFTQGKALFDVGYNATMSVMPELKINYQRFMENR